MKPTPAGRAAFGCSVLITLAWTGMLLWVAGQMGGLLAHFVTHVWPPPLPLRPSILGAVAPAAPPKTLLQAKALSSLRL